MVWRGLHQEDVDVCVYAMFPIIQCFQQQKLRLPIRKSKFLYSKLCVSLFLVVFVLVYCFLKDCIGLSSPVHMATYRIIMNIERRT